MLVGDLQQPDSEAAGAASEMVRRTVARALVVDLCLACVKFIFGLSGGSQALVADAFHSLADSSADVVVLVGEPYWSSPADEDHPHGHGRIETIVTLLIGLVLVGVGIGLIHRSLATLSESRAVFPGWSAFVTACLSIVVKEVLYRWCVRVGERVRSSALLASAWHHRSDALSSVPVAIAVIGSRVYPGWTFLDHVAALIVALLILQAAWHIFWPALRQLADAGANREVCDRLLALARDVDGVKDVHALRTRHMGPGLQADLHVLVDPELTVEQGHDISRDVENVLKDAGAHVVDVLVHVEPWSALTDTHPGGAGSQT